ncbi:sugar transferase [Sphingomonas xinjiangensis]|uniref:Lipopolysaccharide/colanic/teichoic acid biosynthesis glycosyltransferase n=1 Tax=Sphingomonas xinjiangensis TaxID=643568 RepID=A0A840YT09_9SPHN|nr:sugar transferase [Sphingomonas xinjiangensis]MBB5712773.1 lipopolysaccharide/colanic/teichoic acid biosynthesis glycosyltransferase [Sphingomonas xinjiangensis]
MPRALEIVLVALVLPIVAPILLLLMVLVYFDLGRPIFFRQPRPGLHGKVFELLKFRTMTNARDADGVSLPDAQRLTRVGKVLRSLSLDELPSFWNLVRGDIRLVGPRPLLVSYLPLYSPEQARRHDVPPGITGWAQVNGRNALNWEEKFALDVWYVDNRSLWLDLKILWLTVRKVLAREGISAEGEATMSRFTGTKGE